MCLKRHQIHEIPWTQGWLAQLENISTLTLCIFGYARWPSLSFRYVHRFSLSWFSSDAKSHCKKQKIHQHWSHTNKPLLCWGAFGVVTPVWRCFYREKRFCMDKFFCWSWNRNISNIHLILPNKWLRNPLEICCAILVHSDQLTLAKMLPLNGGKTSLLEAFGCRVMALSASEDISI